MEYRTLPRGGEKISVIGMGTSVIGARPEGELIDTVRAACESGSTALTCPAGLDIALINKYYDLAGLGDRLAREHYLTLEKTASDCLARGHRDRRCPFHVPQSQRMETIRAFFGK